MTPLISVVIPVYNRSWELQRALKSLACQTMRDFEVIVCDDGSVEDICAVLAPFESLIDVSYLRIENSGGPARPRNMAIEKARGEWIAFLDSDDWWDDERLAFVKAELSNDLDLLYHSLRVVTAEGLAHTQERRTIIGDPLRGNSLRHLALFGNPVPNSAAVVRRSLLIQIGGICEERTIVAVEDYDTWLRLLEAGARMRFLDQVLGSYWIGEDGISAFSRHQIDRQIALFARHLNKFSPELRIEAEAAHNYTVGSMLLQLGGDNKQARNYLMRANKLPTLIMRIKRYIKLTIIFLRY